MSADLRVVNRCLFRKDSHPPDLLTCGNVYGQRPLPPLALAVVVVVVAASAWEADAFDSSVTG